MGAEGVLAGAAEERNGQRGSGRVGASGPPQGEGVPWDSGALQRQEKGGPWRFFGEDGVCQFRDGGPGVSAPPFRAGEWGFESTLTPHPRGTLPSHPQLHPDSLRTGTNGHLTLLFLGHSLPVAWTSEQILNKQ